MAESWIRLCANSSFVEKDGGVTVKFANDRSQHLTVRESDQAYLLQSVVLAASAMAKANVSPMTIWEINRSLTVVGLRVDHRNRLVGEATIPKIGVTAREFQSIARHLAAECDRYEFIFSGKDLQ